MRFIRKIIKAIKDYFALRKFRKNKSKDDYIYPVD